MAKAWDSAKILIHRTENQELEVDHETLELLSEIDDPVHVISVVGVYRTGKSYLLNYVVRQLTGKDDVFGVGNTVEALTRGVTVWCCPHPSHKGHWFVFLDTEGLNDVKKGDKSSDIQMFVLAVLMSSTLVYNSVGVIDFQALETIHHVSRLAERVRMTRLSDEDTEDIGFDLAFPEFIWVVRDFQLKLEQNGKQISGDEYLENSLSTTGAGLARKEADNLSIKRCLKGYFPKRRCVPLPDMRQLESDQATSCEEGQDDRLAALVRQIQSGDCKMHEGSELTGRVFGRLAAELVSAQQRSQDPINIPLIMNRIAEQENSVAISKSHELYKTLMNEKMTEAVDEVMFHRIHLDSTEQATSLFMKTAVYPIDDAFDELMNRIKLDFKLLDQNNSEKIERLCDVTFKSLRKKIVGESNAKYLCSGGYQKYREDMTEIRRRWEEITVLRGGIGRRFFMEKLKKLKEEEANMIMRAEQDLKALKKEEAEKSRKIERQKMEEMRQLAEKADRNAEAAMKKDREEFSKKIEKKVQGAILRPQEMEISALNCRIAVLERELQELREKRTTEEADNCEHRLKWYRKMLREKQNEPSRWQRASTSIRSFATEAYESVRRFFRTPEVANAVVECATATVTAAASVAAAAASHAAYVALPPDAAQATSVIVSAATQAVSNALSKSSNSRQKNVEQQSQQNVAPYSPQNVAPYSPQNVAPYSQQNVAPYSPQNVAPYSPQNVAPYSPQNVAPYSQQNIAQHSSSPGGVAYQRMQ